MLLSESHSCCYGLESGPSPSNETWIKWPLSHSFLIWLHLHTCEVWGNTHAHWTEKLNHHLFWVRWRFCVSVCVSFCLFGGIQKQTLTVAAGINIRASIFIFKGIFYIIRARNNLFSSLVPDQQHHRFTACIKGLDFQLKEHFGNPLCGLKFHIKQYWSLGFGGKRSYGCDKLNEAAGESQRW